MMDEIGDCGLDVNGRKLSFEYRIGEIFELASEDPIGDEPYNMNLIQPRTMVSYFPL
ncbi:hypothetical protein C5167_007182 [Papaver somniferum]|uniref:Uncharacterized protein n=1 Tax=Papaver somniferum TaxID=3469 RepID=A0A4Y7JIL0_PAPSO|nr:hypothetical protein C5167_007182 [Papaver somniferum]